MSKRTPAPLRVAFDMDGVLADFRSALRRQEAILFGDGPEDATGTRHVRRRHRVWRHARAIENFWETLDETEAGSVSRLAAAAADHRWETIFLTTRPSTAGATVQAQTQRWLIAHGFACPSVFVVRRSRGAIAAALELDVVVDDRLDNCLDVMADSSARVILNWQHATDVPEMMLNRPRLDVVRGVGDALDRVIGLDASRQQPPPSRLSRLLHAIGA